MSRQLTPSSKPANHSNSWWFQLVALLRPLRLSAAPVGPVVMAGGSVEVALRATASGWLRLYGRWHFVPSGAVLLTTLPVDRPVHIWAVNALGPRRCTVQVRSNAQGVVPRSPPRVGTLPEPARPVPSVRVVAGLAPTPRPPPAPRPVASARPAVPRAGPHLPEPPTAANDESAPDEEAP